MKNAQRWLWVFCNLALTTVGSATTASAQPSTLPHRILIIYEGDSTQPVNDEIAIGLRRGLDEPMPTEFEMYSEYLDSYRFPGEANLDRIAYQMAEKYASTQLDAVVALGPTALNFMLGNRESIAPGIPLFFGGVTESTMSKVLQFPDVKGIVSKFDVKQTLALARQLQPSAREAVVLTGSAPFDLSWQSTAKDALGDTYLDFDIRYISDLSIADFTQTVARLPSQTAVLILTINEDAEGQKFVPREVVATIAVESAAPVYAVYDTYVGRGALGGYMGTFQDVGEQLAGIVRRQILGDGDNIPQTTDLVARPVVDWRQMERFGISADFLPENTEVRFRAPSLWAEYRTEILSVAALLLLQTVTIAALVIQAHRRKAAEAEAETGRVELTHLSRASLLGELSGAFAHELNQPLTSILANAQVARQLLKNGEVNPAELSEILSDIEADDNRAAAVISQLRSLLTKGEAVLEPTDLNHIAAATVRLVRSELVAKQTKVDLKKSREEIRVLANFSQLQQVVLNLVVNAVDATQHLPPSSRSIEITVRRNGKSGDIVVSDNGAGLTKDMINDAFKPFVSTKPKGLGLGLSICRSIARAHRGTLQFDGEYSNGARIILSLPLERHAHAQHGVSSSSRR